MTTENASDILDRWYRRFKRSQAVYLEEFKDEEFSDLIAVLVAGGYFEGVLWVAAQVYFGYRPESDDKDLTLVPLIDKTRQLLGPDLEKAMRRFSKIRNTFAHEPDCRLDRSAIEGLEALLPPKNRASLAKGLETFPDYTVGTKARLIFIEMVSALHERLNEENARRRAASAPQAGSSS